MNAVNPKAPSHEVFRVRERGEGQKSVWTKIGAAWTNRDGSLAVVLDALPIDGRMQIRPWQERDEQRGGQAQAQRRPPTQPASGPGRPSSASGGPDDDSLPF